MTFVNRHRFRGLAAAAGTALRSIKAGAGLQWQQSRTRLGLGHDALSIVDERAIDPVGARALSTACSADGHEKDRRWVARGSGAAAC
jgi:hypothetical protein